MTNMAARSLISGTLGVHSNSQEDLQCHGETRYLSDDVGEGAGRRSQGKQVGYAVQDAGDKEGQEVKAGHGKWRSNEGVDGTQEQEG